MNCHELQLVAENQKNSRGFNPKDRGLKPGDFGGFVSHDLKVVAIYTVAIYTVAIYTVAIYTVAIYKVVAMMRRVREEAPEQIIPLIPHNLNHLGTPAGRSLAPALTKVGCCFFPLELPRASARG